MMTKGEGKYRPRWPAEAAIEFALHLQDRRLASGLTQQRLADLVGLHRPTITMYETGRAMPTAYGALRLARALGTTVEDLFGGAS